MNDWLFQLRQRQSRAGDILGGGLNVHVVRASFLKPFTDDAVREFRPIAVAAEVAEIQMAQFGGHNLFRGIGRSVVGEMSVPAQDALLQAPRSAGVFLQQFHIVIGFQQEHIGGADAFDDQFGRVAEVGEETNVARRGAQQESDGIGGVVRHGERIHHDVANLEAGARAEDAALPFHLKLEFDGFFREAVAVERDVQFCAEAGEALDVVGVFVRDQDAGQTFRRAADGGKPLANLPAAESGIDEDSRLCGFQIGAVTAGTAAEDR